MSLLTNSTYGKSTLTSVLVHCALIVAFILMPPSSPVNSAKNVTTIEVVPLPEQKITPPKEEIKPDINQPRTEQAAGEPEPAHFADALPGETSANSVALRSGTGTAIPSATGLPPMRPGNGGTSAVSASRAYAPKPAYPRAAREAGWEGSVVLRIRINTDGSVTVLSVREGGRSDASEAAVEAVSSWRYSPARDSSGVPVSTVRDVRVTFDLREAM
ncbi:MAG: TonB family protein [Negativicutes bacterium]|nr:TonB family protein [Negativicutes bacterium]MDR3591205.1 TonB family protein [Negativicutes bacterium]